MSYRHQLTLNILKLMSQLLKSTFDVKAKAHALVHSGPLYLNVSFISPVRSNLFTSITFKLSLFAKFQNRTIKEVNIDIDFSRYGLTTRPNSVCLLGYELQISSLLFDLFPALSYGFSFQLVLFKNVTTN